MISRTHANTHTLSIHPVAASVTWERSNLAPLVLLLPPSVSSAPPSRRSWSCARSCTWEWTPIKSIKAHVLSRSPRWDRGIGRQGKQHGSKRNAARSTRFADKTAHHLTDQSCRKLLAASSSLPRSLKTRLTRQRVSVQLKASLCTCRGGRKTTLFTGTAHANMQINTDYTSDARVSTNRSVLTRHCQSHFHLSTLCLFFASALCWTIKEQRGGVFSGLLKQDNTRQRVKIHYTAYSSATFNRYCKRNKYTLRNEHFLFFNYSIVKSHKIMTLWLAQIYTSYTFLSLYISDEHNN